MQIEKSWIIDEKKTTNVERMMQFCEIKKDVK